MRTVTKIACRTIGVVGMAMACADSAKVAKQFSSIGSDHAQERYLEKVYYSTRTIDKVSPASNALREKGYDLRSKNPLPSVGGKIHGGFQGFMYGMANFLPVIACSSLAILGKNILAKIGAFGVAGLMVFNILHNSFGVGKNNPMD